ncbi:unnamed protein product [Ranitomeya imitator]|uniref:Reverse transcriptase domain-containing protein n=1 Tax=Ranitomeya imitator TaxID=111125 RepID=A0ABN9LYA9_9NEOB|nr:unnamed protein product [Ranitomeya imitator]
MLRFSTAVEGRKIRIRKIRQDGTGPFTDLRNKSSKMPPSMGDLGSIDIFLNLVTEDIMKLSENKRRGRFNLSRSEMACLCKLEKDHSITIKPSDKGGIHKGTTPLKERPIVSGNNSLAERLGIYVDKILKPFVHALNSYVRDTTNLLGKLDGVYLEDDMILASIDVEALYSSIPHDKGLLAVNHFLSTRGTQYDRHNKFVLEALKFCLTRNVFVFDRKYFHQLRGTAMGSPCAPSYANLLLGWWEEVAVFGDSALGSDERIILWLRYIDDVLVIWRGGIDDFDMDTFEVVKDLNLFIRRLKWKKFFLKEDRRQCMELGISDELLQDVQMLFHLSDLVPNQDGTGPFTDLRNKSSKMPPSMGDLGSIDIFLNLVTEDIMKLSENKRRGRFNLSRSEMACLCKLEKDHSITIKPSDKGGNVVIMNTADYRTMCLSLLNRKDEYRVLSHNPMGSFLSELSAIVEGACVDGVVEKEEEYLVPKNPVIPTFYCLPKIHKGTTPLKGRPIVSGNNSLTERLGIYVDKILKPFVHALNSYVRDTTDLLGKLDGVYLEDDMILASIDKRKCIKLTIFINTLG